MKKTLFAVVASVACVAPALAHHSFAMFDQTKTVTWTGVATRFVAQANHATVDVRTGPGGSTFTLAFPPHPRAAEVMRHEQE